MGGHRLAGPHRADFVSGIVANGENKIHVRRAGLGEFVPAFAAQSGSGQTGTLQLPNGERMDAACGLAAGTEGAKVACAAMIQNGLRENGSRGVADAEE
jgi:hypothetical protein